MINNIKNAQKNRLPDLFNNKVPQYYEISIFCYLRWRICLQS
jgi:hypothetical protein